MTKAEQRKIANEMERLAARAKHKVTCLCSAISLPYELEALKLLRREIDSQIAATEALIEYSEKNKL